MWPDMIRHQAQKDDGVISYLVESSEIVGPAAEEAASVCSMDIVPLEPNDVRVVAMKPAERRIRGTVVPISFDCCEVKYGDYGKVWEIPKRPEGYAVVVRDSDDYDVRSTVRHELAHACCWEEDLYTYESKRNHMEWCRKLDCEQTMY